MGLDLRHGDDEIRLKHGAGKPQVLHACVTGAQTCAEQFVSIEIDETDLFLLELLMITTLRQHKLRVALMTWALGRDDRLGAHSTKRLRCRKNQKGMRVDCIAGGVVDQIGLENDSFPSDVDPKKPQASCQNLIQ